MEEGTMRRKGRIQQLCRAMGLGVLSESEMKHPTAWLRVVGEAALFRAKSEWRGNAVQSAHSPMIPEFVVRVHCMNTS